MKKRFINLSLILILIISFTTYCSKSEVYPTEPQTSNTSTAALGGSSSFPSDFAIQNIIDRTALPASSLKGFGGNKNLNQSQNRAALKKIPVILIHGQGADADSKDGNMSKMRDMLKAIGYNDSEIWAPSYINGSPDINYAYSKNIEELREFIDAVIAYLNVPKVDIISHSFGVNLTRAYINGYNYTGDYKTFNNSNRVFNNSTNHRLDKVSTVVVISGGNYGLKETWAVKDEWTMNEYFTVNLNKFNGQESLTPPGSDRITYVAIRTIGDAIDNETPSGCPVASTSHLRGAINLEANLTGSAVQRHYNVVSDQATFDKFKGYLNKSQAPNVSFNPDGARFEQGQTINVTLSGTNNPVEIKYQISTNLLQAQADENSWINYPLGSQITISQTSKIFAKGRNENGWGSISVSKNYDNRPVPVVSLSPNSANFDDTINVNVSINNNPTEKQYQIANTGSITPDDSKWIALLGNTITVDKSCRLFVRAKNDVDWGVAAIGDYIRNTPPVSVKFKVTSNYSLKSIQLIGYPATGTMQYKLEPYSTTWLGVYTAIYVQSFNTFLRVKITSEGTTRQFYIQNPYTLADGEYEGTEEPVN